MKSREGKKREGEIHKLVLTKEQHEFLTMNQQSGNAQVKCDFIYSIFWATVYRVSRIFQPKFFSGGEFGKALGQPRGSQQQSGKTVCHLLVDALTECSSTTSRSMLSRHGKNCSLEQWPQRRSDTLSKPLPTYSNFSVLSEGTWCSSEVLLKINLNLYIFIISLTQVCAITKCHQNIHPVNWTWENIRVSHRNQNSS